MKKILQGAGLTAAISALAFAPAAVASEGPNNTGDGTACGGPSGGSCTWHADVQGNYAGVTSGTYSVTETATQTVNGVTSTCTSTVADGGAGGFLGILGVVQPNTGQPATGACAGYTYTGDYTLTVTGSGGGAIGSVTGQPGAA